MKIAVYGTLKQGGRLHYLLEGSKRLDDVMVPGTLYMNKGGAYPRFIYDKDGKDIQMEVYEVSANIFEIIYATESAAGYRLTELSDGTLLFESYNHPTLLGKQIDRFPVRKSRSAQAQPQPDGEATE